MTEKQPLIINRIFNAPVEKVWDAWTNPEHMKTWWGPKPFTAPTINIDFRVGGTCHACMHAFTGRTRFLEYWHV